jgi:S1-C subfamily serine protease
VLSVNHQVSEGSVIPLPGAIQTSAEINRGNCGGALVDLSRRAILADELIANDSNATK